MVGERVVEIFAKAHALARRRFARSLSQLGVDALQAPALRAAHFALAAILPRVRGSRPTPWADSKDSRIAHDFAVSMKGGRVLMARKMMNEG